MNAWSGSIGPRTWTRIRVPRLPASTAETVLGAVAAPLSHALALGRQLAPRRAGIGQQRTIDLHAIPGIEHAVGLAQLAEHPQPVLVQVDLGKLLLDARQPYGLDGGGALRHLELENELPLGPGIRHFHLDALPGGRTHDFLLRVCHQRAQPCPRPSMASRPVACRKTRSTAIGATQRARKRQA